MKRRAILNRFPVIFLTLVLLIGCSNDVGTDKDSEKLNEMTKEDTLEFLEQMTYRYVEALEKEDGSFEQRSSLQAAIGRAESVYEEITEDYEDLPILESFADISTHAKLGAEKGLEEQFIYMEIHFENIEEIIHEVSDKHLDGELPSSLKNE